MPTSNTVYGTTAAVTITIVGQNSSLVQVAHSALVDNSTDLAIDMMARFKTKVGATGTANTQWELWAYGSMDGASGLPHNDSDAMIATTAAINVAMSVTKKPQMKLLHIEPIGADGASATYDVLIGSVAAAFGGLLPKYVGFAFCHNWGAVPSATAGDHALEVTPIKFGSA
jgi:hypothetical protein